MSGTFSKTTKQTIATKLIAGFMYVLLFGGSRSGKTFLIIRCIIIRACKTKSRHVILRKHFNHLKASIIYDTLPMVLELCFPNLPSLDSMLNKSDWFLTLPNGSTIWFAGLDDKARTEKVLGTEYSTIYYNESSMITYDSFLIGLTRLAETSGLKLRCILDCNPPGKKHWIYKIFFKAEDPISGEAKIDFEEDYTHLQMNPTDNEENLSPAYLKILRNLPKRQRQRFLDGLFLEDVEGALWTDEMVSWTKHREPGNIVKTVVALDPSTTNNKGSDECGIIVASKDDLDQGIVEADLSRKTSTNKWANIAVSAYHDYAANYIVAESNQGGDLVKDVIKNIDPNIKVRLVHASKSKKARGEPVAQLYEEEQKRIIHMEDFMELEEELTQWVPDESTESPNRLDGLVWALSDLFFGKGQPNWDLF